MTMAKNSPEHALSFGQAASHYDAIRPTYPADAVRWTLGSTASEPSALGRVVDLGAGTGLLSRVIRDVSGVEVVPVEPDPGMRAQLRAASPDLVPVAGSAESIPLPDGSVDAVLAGTAYHWFDREIAHAEIGRIVRPGGVFAPIWNVRDESVGWVAEYTALTKNDRPDVTNGVMSDPDFGTLFGPVESATFRHSVPMVRDDLVELMKSRSYYLAGTPDRRARLVTAVSALAAKLPDSFDVPYLTYCYRAARIE
jgi:SAM-dependent methyltransferase